jgi:hypothetical protein
MRGYAPKGKIIGAYVNSLQPKDLVPDMHYIHQTFPKVPYTRSIWDFPESLVHIVHIWLQLVGLQGLSICTKHLGIGAYADHRKEGRQWAGFALTCSNGYGGAHEWRSLRWRRQRSGSLRQTIRSTCRIRCPLPVTDPVGGPVRCSGGGWLTPAAVQRGTHRGAKLGCVSRKGAKGHSVICKRN